MAYPTPETVQNHGVKTPDDFDRESFRVAVVEAHTFAGAQLLEMACFLEPHASGEGVRMGEFLALEAGSKQNSQKYTTSTAQMGANVTNTTSIGSRRRCVDVGF